MTFRQYKRNFWVHIDGILCFRNAFLSLFLPSTFCKEDGPKKRHFDGCSKWPASIHRGCLAYLGLSGIV